MKTEYNELRKWFATIDAKRRNKRKFGEDRTAVVTDAKPLFELIQALRLPPATTKVHDSG